MDSPIQMATLIECPSYPNSIAWSEENLVAVASGSVVTILNPGQISGPRGLIKLPPSRPFSIGVVKEEDVCIPCLLPQCLSRDTHPCARSISWSPIGFAPNSGCVLAVCTTEGGVKLYHAPLCEYRTDWVEAVDISKALYDYLVSINFDESSKSHGSLDKELSEEASVTHVENEILSPNPIQFNDVKSKRFKAPSLRKGRHFASKADEILPVITAEKYASRIAMLSSLIVVWSSVVSLSLESCACLKYSVLAVGGKSGKISLWRFHHPEYYTIEHERASLDTTFVGLLQAHDGWVSAISWGVLTADPLKPRLLLATGSSDGSVKLWVIDGRQLVLSSDAKFMPIQLLKEMTSITHIPISTLSIATPTESPEFFTLAVGKGSGSLEVWLCHFSSCKLERLGDYNAHNRVVTGLVWGFDGRHLYSCSQDGSIYCWDIFVDLRNDWLSNHLMPNEPIVITNLLDPCFGLALSPGNLIIATVHSLDVGLLNPMYQAQTQKAAVEFLWSSPEKESVSSMRPNILWSLERLVNPETPLVLWDVLFAVRVFKQSGPVFMENMLLDWLTSVCFSHASNDAIMLENIPRQIQSFFPQLSIRMIHILNIICRCLILPEMNIQDELAEENSWEKLLTYSEDMIRVRVVMFSLQAAAFCTSEGNKSWSPAGLVQMKRWIFMNKHLLDDFSVDESFASKNSVHEDGDEESCSFCSSPVPFVTPESAVCRRPSKSSVGTGHKLTRCAVSMKLSPLSSLQWFCVSCRRWASHLLPGSFFTSFDQKVDRDILYEKPKPLCPFCGILLQRYVPNFLLSVNPV